MRQVQRSTARECRVTVHSAPMERAMAAKANNVKPKAKSKKSEFNRLIREIKKLMKTGQFLYIEK